MQFSASLGLTTIQNFSGCGGFGGQVLLSFRSEAGEDPF